MLGRLSRRVCGCALLLCVAAVAVDCENEVITTAATCDLLQQALANGNKCIDVTGQVLNCTSQVVIPDGVSVKIFATSGMAIVDGGNTFTSIGQSKNDGSRLFYSYGDLHLENLTLTKAFAHRRRTYGGAVWIKKGNFKAVNVVFTQNFASRGSGFYLTPSGQTNALIEDSVFQDSEATYQAAAAEIYARGTTNNGTTEFRRCTFQRLVGAYNAGSIIADFSGSNYDPVIFRDCVFPTNSNYAGGHSPDVLCWNQGKMSFYGTSVSGSNFVDVDKCGSSCTDYTDTSQCTSITFYGHTTWSKDCFSCLPCSHCPAGHYRDRFVGFFDIDRDCSVCPAGRYQPSTSASSCLACPPGRYAEDDGITWESHLTCRDCPAGLSATSGSRCCEGYGMPHDGSNNNTCVVCPQGTFAHNSQCTVCPAGKYANRPGLTACLQCPSGKVIIDDGNLAAEHVLESSCSYCSPLYRSDTNGTACSLCAPGTERHGGVCRKCEAGWYSATDSQCTACPPGKHIPHGTSSPEEHAFESACQSCPVGTASPSHATSSCTVCMPGQYADETGSRECKKCAPGRYLADDHGDRLAHVTELLCRPCQIGQASNISGSPNCPVCQAGRYSPGLGLTSCYDCLPGFVSDGLDDFTGKAIGDSTCTACPPGKFGSSSTNCMSCPAGSFQSFSGKTKCDICQAGRSQSEPGQMECDMCAAGKFGSSSTSCTLCPAGSFQNSSGKAECNACPAGRSQAAAGRTECHRCPAGKFGSSSTSCTFCPAGSFQSLPEKAKCDACPPGRIQPELGQTDCHKCPAGKFRINSSVCALCPAGSFQNIPGEAQCEACPAGHSQPKSGQKECHSCPAGRFSSSSRACTMCPAGSFQNSSGKTMCEACPAGRSQPALDQTECHRCPAGKFGINATSCTFCLVGRFQNSSGETNCDACPAGRSQPESGQKECHSCPAGRFASSSTKCTLCPAGTFQNSSGKSICEACPAGRIQTAFDQTECERCPAGKFGMNSTSCTLCPSGRFQRFPERAECDECPAGSSQSEAGKTECRTCSDGFTSEVGALACQSCPVGTHLIGGDAGPCDWDILVLSAFVIGFCIQTFAAYTFASSVRRRLQIEDVSHAGSRVVMTMVGRHHMRPFWGDSIPVCISGAGHRDLNKPGYFYRVRVLDTKRFELLSRDGVPIESPIETSRGILMQRFPHELLNQNSWGLFCRALLVLPWLLLVAISYLRDRSNVTLSFLIVVNIGSPVMAALAAMATRLWRSTRPTLWEVRLQKFGREVLASNPKSWRKDLSLRTERGASRGVRLQNVIELLDAFCDKIQERTAYYLVPDIVMPLTETLSLSYAELVGPQCLDYFVSHYWGTHFSHFVASLRHHGNSVSTSSCNSLAYWICFFSNSQWHIEDELGSGDWKQSSFYLALTHDACRGTCMVLDAMALPLTRSWCLFEVLHTYKHGPANSSNWEGLHYCTDRGVMGVGSSTCYDEAIQLTRRLTTLTLADASASNKDDENTIKELVELEGGMALMDKFMKDNMLDALRTIQAKFCNEVRDFEVTISVGTNQCNDANADAAKYGTYVM